MSKETKS